MEKKILIIEDEPDIREALAEYLRDAKFVVSTAAQGEKGLELALQEQPDLILLDIKMPVMDGHEVLQKLRQDPWGQNVKVIMLTSMDDVKNVGEAHEGDIQDYIIKAHHGLDEILIKVREVVYAE